MPEDASKSSDAGDARAAEMAADVQELRRAVVDLGKMLKAFGKKRVDALGEDLDFGSEELVKEGNRMLQDMERRLGEVEKTVERNVREHPGAGRAGGGGAASGTDGLVLSCGRKCRPVAPAGGPWRCASDRGGRRTGHRGADPFGGAAGRRRGAAAIGFGVFRTCAFGLGVGCRRGVEPLGQGAGARGADRGRAFECRAGDIPAIGRAKRAGRVSR